jgi:hypothetical protein
MRSRPNQREVLIEEGIVEQPVGFVLDQARGERLAERLALDSRHSNGTYSIQALRNGDRDAAAAKHINEFKETISHEVATILNALAPTSTPSQE